MVDITLNDLTCIMKFDNENEKRIIKKFVSYDDTSSCFMGGKWRPERKKVVCLGKDIKDYFVVFAGLCKEICIECKKNNIKINYLEDKRTHFKFQEKEYTDEEIKKYLPNFDYVDHQIRAIKAMLKTNTALIKASTSAGKTTTFIGYMKITNLPTLVLVDKVTLGAQLADEINKAGIDCGFCSGKGIKEGYCMVSTIQSVKKLGDLTRYKCMIVDECHLSSSSTFQEFFKQFGCPLKFGFTASPYNGDYLKYAMIRQFLGSIAVEINSDELIENGVMAKPTLYFIKNECEDTFDYVSAYEIGIVNNKRRNQKIIDIASKYDRGVAILVASIEHGKMLEEQIENSKFISGETSLEERRKYIKMFNDGELKVLIGSTILNTGISISNMYVLIQAAGQKAITSTIQRIGRVLRITKDKKTAAYYDFIDNGNRFLVKHSKDRVKLFKKEGYNDIKILDENLEEINTNK